MGTVDHSHQLVFELWAEGQRKVRGGASHVNFNELCMNPLIGKFHSLLPGPVSWADTNTLRIVINKSYIGFNKQILL